MLYRWIISIKAAFCEGSLRQLILQAELTDLGVGISWPLMPFWRQIFSNLMASETLEKVTSTHLFDFAIAYLLLINRVLIYYMSSPRRR